MKRALHLLAVLIMLRLSSRADDFRDSLSVLLSAELDSSTIAAMSSSLNDQLSIERTEEVSRLFADFLHSDEFMNVILDIYEPDCRRHLYDNELADLLKGARTRGLPKKKVFVVPENTMIKYHYACEKALSQKLLVGMQLFGGLAAYIMRYAPDMAPLFNDSALYVFKQPVPHDTLPAETTAAPKRIIIQDIPEQMLKQGEKLWLKSYVPIVPEPEEDYLTRVPASSVSTHVGVVKHVRDDNTALVHVYPKNNPNHLVATRSVITPNKAGIDFKLVGKQTDFYPSGKVKEIRYYNIQNKLQSLTTTDTLGNIIKTIEYKDGLRTEKQYHTNGQLRLQRITAGQETHAKYYDKTGRQVSYLEGDLFAYDDGIYVVSGHKPTYPGGQEAMRKYIDEHTRPRGVTNTQVVCSVHVKADGTIGEVRVKNSSGITEVDEEAVRVLKSMPQWNPGTVKKWKFVQNVSDAKVQIIQTKFSITVYFDR